jgi:hypothetical protein
MCEKYEQFEHFKSALRSPGSESRFLLEAEKEYTVYYIPFEHVSVEAQLVLVGITPGPRQIDCSRVSAQRLLARPGPDSNILREIKRSCAFAGMRERINNMLDHFGIPSCIGIASASLLWDSSFVQFFPTSIIPNAAFEDGQYFNGPFSAVLNTPLLLRQFKDVFIPSIRSLNRQALYIGLGPVVDKALKWCVSAGVLDERQILGYFPHASASSGSQFAYFLRKKRLGDLKPGDPVRNRAHDLDAAYERIKSNLNSLFPGHTREG